MTTTPEQLQAWRKEFHKAFPARALTEYDQAPTDNDYIFVGYLRAKQQTEQVMKLAKFGAMVLQNLHEDGEALANGFSFSSRAGLLDENCEIVRPEIDLAMKELLK